MSTPEERAKAWRMMRAHAHEIVHGAAVKMVFGKPKQVKGKPLTFGSQTRKRRKPGARAPRVNVLPKTMA